MSHEPRAFLREACVKRLSWLSLLSAMLLSACGGGSSSGAVPIPLTLSGNWQFTLAAPPDGSFLGGPQGGFLLQTAGAVTGGASYAVYLPGLAFPCSSGSAQVTGTITGQSVTLTAVAGTQTFTLTGMLNSESSTMSGIYASSAGTAGDGSPCGTQQAGLQWNAVSVPPITGPVQGSFHSAGGTAGLDEQDFLVTGGLSQADNTGASSATVTGNLTFLNAATDLSDYPCFSVASVNGQISGNVVNLQIVGPDGSAWGQIGEPAGGNGVAGLNLVTFTSAHGGYILNGVGPTYMVATAACPGNLGNPTASGDFGNICLALNGASACQQPITLTPSSLAFPSQVLGSPSTTQTITLANASGSTLGSMTVALANNSGAANFTETDTCGLEGIPSQGQPFLLAPGQSCAVAVMFAPQETCAPGTPPSQCPSPLTATLTVTSPNNDTIFTAPISGTAVSPGAASPATQTVSTSSNRTPRDVEHHAEIY